MERKYSGKVNIFSWCSISINRLQNITYMNIYATSSLTPLRPSHLQHGQVLQVLSMRIKILHIKENQNFRQDSETTAVSLN